RVVPTNYDPKGERFLIASRFPTPPLTCAFFSPGATVTTNVVNAPREPVVDKQDHSVNPPPIDECCCECGNALDGIYCQQCICKSCGKGAHTGYNCPPRKIPACCDDDDDDDDVDCTIAITIVLSTKETDNSLTKDLVEIVINSNDDISSSGDDSLYKENIEYIEASPHNSEVVSLEAAEIVIPKVEEIEDDNLREKL
nr:hypothetical protein [Tanacetum cinerariifolium]